MKLYFLIIMFTVARLNAQPCIQVKVDTDIIKRKILSDFISKSIENNYFVNDKGIVHLTIYKDEEGLTRWYLKPIIDDRYKDNPPSKFADFDGDIILVYEGDLNGNPLKNVENLAAVINCLGEKIGDRVYIRPPLTKDRWTSHEYKTGTGKVIRRGKRRITGGNSGDIIIIFKEDGSYETLTPV